MWINRKQWQELWAHITRTNHELGEVQKNMSIVRNDVKWLKWLVGLVVAGVLTLVLKSLVL